MALAPATRARLHASLAGAGGLLIGWRFGGAGPIILAGILVALAVLAWLSPVRYAPIQRGLDRMVHGLMVGLTWVLLALIYLGVFTPLRVWRVLSGRDPLQQQPDSSAPTYLVPARPPGPNRFDRQF